MQRTLTEPRVRLPANVRPAAQNWLNPLTLTILVTGAYFLAARISLFIVSQPEGIAVLWPAAGVGAGILIALGHTARWPVFAGVLLGTLLANFSVNYEWKPSLVFAVANAIECAVIARLFSAFGDAHTRFMTLTNILALLGAITVSVFFASMTGAAMLTALGHSQGSLTSTWLIWARADTIGAITTAPFIIELLDRRSRVRTPVWEYGEGTLATLLFLLAAFQASTLIDASGPLAVAFRNALLFPLIVWIASRTPAVFSAALPLLFSAVIVTKMGLSIGAYGTETIPFADRIAAAQLTLITTTFCALVLASVFEAERQAKEIQERLIAQLDHRVKNSLALVLSMLENSTAQETGRQSTIADISRRIHSLARVHTRLSSNWFEGACLADVAADELAPYRTGTNVSIGGGDMVLHPRAVQPVSIVLHELCTNSAKYGALSVPAGRVDLTWSLTVPAETGERSLEIIWSETGGPLVHLPAKESYGMRTIRGLLPYELSAGVDLDYRATGLYARFTIPAHTALARADTNGLVQG